MRTPPSFSRRRRCRQTNYSGERSQSSNSPLDYNAIGIDAAILEEQHQPMPAIVGIRDMLGKRVFCSEARQGYLAQCLELFRR